MWMRNGETANRQGGSAQKADTRTPSWAKSTVIAPYRAVWSKNSTPKELLERLSPRLTVISSGRNNRYGHPHAELLERLEESGTVIAQTARYGAITVDFAHDGVLFHSLCPPMRNASLSSSYAYPYYHKRPCITRQGTGASPNCLASALLC